MAPLQPRTLALLLLLLLLPVLRGADSGEVPAAPPHRTVMAWMGWGDRTDAQLDTIVSYFIANRDAITTASPTTHSLGENATLIERNLSKTATATRAKVFSRLRAGGVRVVPTIWNDAGGMHTALLPKFLQLAAAPDGFIAEAVALAEAEDLDGWNVDFELGAADWDAGDCRLVWPDPHWGPRCEKVQKAGAYLVRILPGPVCNGTAQSGQDVVGGHRHRHESALCAPRWPHSKDHERLLLKLVAARRAQRHCCGSIHQHDYLSIISAFYHRDRLDADAIRCAANARKLPRMRKIQCGFCPDKLRTNVT
jgi:hypothetical protein